ncbi:MAG: hypothetical protein HW419_3650 [Deltaproteobacteria bacterium]|nr:hypothetical protein [Deltaproteobacteria bacterium]
MVVNGAKRKLSFKIIIAAIILLSSAPSAWAQETKQTLAAAAILPSAQAIKSCMSRQDGAECLDNLIREALKTNSTFDALQLIQRLEKEDPDIRRDCHPIVHAIGRETFRIKGNIHDSFNACDQTCHSGCYHGSVERFLRGENIYAEANKHPSTAELKQKAAIACDPKVAPRFRFQCLHGLGHALLFFSAYKLASSLEICDIMGEEWSRASCYGGVFMENVFNATPETRDLSPTDFHYPCNKLDKKYRYECYVMQTSRMTEMGLTTAQVFHECAKADEFRESCTISIGRDLSNDVRLGKTSATAEKCEIATGDSRLNCIRGVIYALIDNTWDGRYAMPFCAALSQDSDQNACYRDSASYLKSTFEKSPKEIATECAKNLSQPQRCVERSAS